MKEMIGRYIIFLISFSVLFCCSMDISGQENLIYNPGFEFGHDEGYNLTAINGSQVEFSGTSSEVFEGDSALKVEINTIGTGGPQVIGIRQDVSDVVSGRPYMASCFVSGPVGQDFRIRILGNEKQVMNFTVSSAGYNKYEFLLDPLLASSDGEYLFAVEFAFSGNTPGTWYIDDLEFYDWTTAPGNLMKAYVSPDGDDSNPGTIDLPLKSVGVAFEKLAGDTIFLLEGEYHEESFLTGNSGGEESPIVIQAFPGHKVLFNGTVAIDSEWNLHAGNIYKTQFGKTVWQLFKGDTLLMPARWPNAFLHDGSVWDRERNWGHGNESLSSNGVAVDDPSGNNDLAASGIDATGAMAIMNVGSWKTSARMVTSHSAGSSTFEYEPVPFTYKNKHHYYYLEGSLELLDSPGEWCYVDSTAELYVWSYDNSPPANEISGKDQSYALSFSGCNYIVVKGIDFFATTLKFENCKGISVEDCNFNFASSSKRALMSNAEPDVLTMTNSGSQPTNNSIKNCEIRNTESQAFYLDGNNNTVENCRIENIDWVVADRPGLMNSIYLSGDNNTFRRNTVSQCGASSTIYPGNFPLVELNRVWSTGYMQSDGSITQVVINGQPGSVIRNNWFHNTIKSGARFDAPIPPTVWGNGGTMRHNVVWETNSGLMLKGERHYCFNNTVFECVKNGIIVLDDSNEGGGGNVGSISRNNISDRISGTRNGYLAVPGEYDHNWNGYENESSYKAQLIDPSNLDFRPNPDGVLIDGGDLVEGHTIEFFGEKPDIGAYEYGDTVYWIGGRKEALASTPVPRNGSVSYVTRIDLMWLEAYKSHASHLYFSTDSASVAGGTTSGDAYQGLFTNNIFHPGKLQGGGSYFWRVDAVLPDGKVSRGEVWRFTSFYNANEVMDTLHFKIYSDENSVITKLDSAAIKIAGQVIYTDTLGEARILVRPDTYTYEISKIDYFSKEGSLTTTPGLLITDTLYKSHVEVSFSINSGIIPLQDAEVIFGSETASTDSEGFAGFYHVKIDISILYIVSKSGYEPVNSSIHVIKDTLINIDLLEVGIDDERIESILNLYPVPASDKLYIKFSHVDSVYIRIIDLSGRIILEELVQNEISEVNVSTFKSGVYRFEIIDRYKGLIASDKFVVTH